MGGKLEAEVQAVQRKTASAGFVYLGTKRTDRGM